MSLIDHEVEQITGELEQVKNRLLDFIAKHKKEAASAGQSYLHCVAKYDSLRGSMAAVVEKLGGEVNPPDDYTGSWSEWLTKEVFRLLK